MTVHGYLDLYRRRKTIKDDLAAVNAEIAEAETALLAEWTATGVQRVTVDGATVHLRREMAVRHRAGTSATAEALRSAGLFDLLGPQPARLKAWLKDEMHRDDLDEWDVSRVPGPLRDVIDVSEIHRLGVRGG